VNANIYNDIEANDKDLFSEIEEKYSAYFLRVDKARPKGKQSGTNIFTIIINEENKHRPIGWHDTLEESAFIRFDELFNEFVASIGLWKNFLIDKDLSKENSAYHTWYELIKNFAKLEKENGFKPANQFIKLMLKDDDFMMFTKNYSDFIKKKKFDLKIPDEDWLKNKELMRELDK
ncbi:MAG TPA: hypothetical protein PK771_14820, partial [Spirochaetota bacterium]|nr:hypothetical protein [Spirochaetota bacterium]